MLPIRQNCHLINVFATEGKEMKTKIPPKSKKTLKAAFSTCLFKCHFGAVFVGGHHSSEQSTMSLQLRLC